MRSLIINASMLLASAGLACVVWLGIAPVPRAVLGPSPYGGSKLLFAPDSQSIATPVSMPDGRCFVRLWNLTTGDEVQLNHDSSPLQSLAFSPDGKTVATRRDDNAIQLFDRTSGRLLAAYSTFKDWRSDCPIVFSSSGKLLIYGPTPDSGTFWEVESRFQAATLFEPDDIRLLPDVSWKQSPLIVARHGNRVKVWSLADAKSKGEFECPASDTLTFSYSGQSVVAHTWLDADLKVWDAVTGKSYYFVLGKMLLGATISPDGKSVALTNCEMNRSTSTHLTWLYRRLFGEWQYEMRVVNVATGSTLGRIGGVLDAQFSPDGKLIATVSEDYSIQVYDFPFSKSTWPAASFVAVFAVLLLGPRWLHRRRAAPQ